MFVHALTILMRSLTLVATSYPDPSLPWYSKKEFVFFFKKQKKNVQFLFKNKK